MKSNWSHINRYRKAHPVNGQLGDDTAGCFYIPHPTQPRVYFMVLANNGDYSDWEHVSLHVRDYNGKEPTMRTPTWDEMCHVKNLFWDETEAVVQYYPAKADYVNTHQHVLHLWRPTKTELPTPPRFYV